MPCETISDDFGTSYYIPDVEPSVTPGGRELPGSPCVEVWWARLFTDRSDEKLLIRQEGEKRVDVIELTFGQAYDLIDALNRAVEIA